MNTTKKWTAVLLALVMALTLAACGGGKSGGKSVGSSKPDSNLGKYIGEEVLSSDNEWVPFDDYCAIIGLNQKDLENQGILA